MCTDVVGCSYKQYKLSRNKYEDIEEYLDFE